MEDSLCTQPIMAPRCHMTEKCELRNTKCNPKQAYILNPYVVESDQKTPSLVYHT